MATTVRMYCQGFGDCFLLDFDGFRVMIDCGVVRNTPGERDRMRRVAEDVLATTNGELDVLVITHEHWDHVCGFQHAADVWARFKRIGQLWLAWTEDHTDPEAREVAKYHRDAYGLSLRAREALQGVSGDVAEHARLDSLLSLLPAFSDGTAAALSSIVETAKGLGAEVKYLKPGRVESVGSAQAAVLGPPRDKAKIKDLLGGSGDTFGHLAALAADAGVGPAGSYEEQMRQALGLAPLTAPPCPPFSASYVLRRPEPGSTPEDRRAVYSRWRAFAKGAANPRGLRIDKRYARNEEKWRRIDGQGLGAFERLAMQLDSLTNNVSLVLAFVVGEKTLLFPGDAQIGNWKSWGDQTYPLDGGPKTIESLMSAVRVYKAGHHASHNGTCRPGRFDLMPSGTISLVPFEKVKQWPSIPEETLIEALRAKGPVAVVEDAATVEEPFRPGPHVPEWGRPLYVEVEV